VDLLQPCTSFNRVQTHQWFRENTYYLNDSHNSRDRIEAFKRATETEKLPLGILYVHPDKLTFEENLGVYRENKDPLYRRKLSLGKLHALIESKRGL
jgi:2-oxoglutarate ferredoxin oxidoreductase subunit beta